MTSPCFIQWTLGAIMMTANNNPIILIFSILGICISSLLGCKQEIVRYETGAFEGAEEGKVLKNKSVGFADTTLAHVHGVVVDNENEILPTADIEAIRLSDNTATNIRTGFDGKYELYLIPDVYHFQFKLAGMDTIIIDSLNLKSGELRRIDISLGKAGTMIHYMIEEKVKPKNK